MTASIRRRLDGLEAACSSDAGRCFVLTYALGETPDDALRRAPGPGGYLVVGEVLLPEVWDPLAREQQAALVASDATQAFANL